jgi:hypothetical protein
MLKHIRVGHFVLPVILGGIITLIAVGAVMPNIAFHKNPPQTLDLKFHVLAVDECAGCVAGASHEKYELKVLYDNRAVSQFPVCRTKNKEIHEPIRTTGGAWHVTMRGWVASPYGDDCYTILSAEKL